MLVHGKMKKEHGAPWETEVAEPLRQVAPGAARQTGACSR